MAETPQAAGPAQRPPGVLVAEDQAGLRALFCLALSGEGFRAWPAADGDEAVRTYTEFRAEINVVLLDRGMPVKDGRAALAELRAINPAVPCCLMTGAGRDAEEELLALGTTCVLSKPFDLPAMIALMRELCARGSKPAAPSLRVLAADANAESVAGLCRVLALWGHEARAAHDGDEALAAAAEFGPDVVLLDLGLPGLNSFEVARRLHAIPGLGGVVFVALARQDDTEQHRLAAEAGFAVHILKPADMAELEAVLAGLAREKAKRPPVP